MTIVLQSTENHTINRSLILPIVGKITFDDLNRIELDESLAEQLLAVDCGLNLIKVNSRSKENSPPLTDKAKKALENLGMSDLKSLLKDFPIEETKHLSARDKILNYLKTKFNA